MIKSMHLTNIQSWKDETIEFSDKLVNIVSARSERGKTVLYKVFYQMVFPNYYKFGSRNDLIRRGCSFGEVELELYNFTKIIFHCEHKEQWFKMQRICDDDWVVYYQSSCPNEIINELGLIVDYELQYILNIYIKDNQYPFINTSKTWNAVLFNQVFKNEKLDKVIETLSSEVKELGDLQKKLNTQLNYKTIQNNQISYTDLDKIANAKNTLIKLNEYYDVLDEIKKVMVKYEEHLRTYEEIKDKVFDVVDIVDIKNIYLTVRGISKVTNDLEPNLNVLENMPDHTEIGEQVSGIRSLFNLVSNIDSYSSKIESKLIDYSRSITEINKVNQIKSNTLAIKDLIGVLSNINSKLVLFEDKFIEQAKICQKIAVVEKELEEVKSKIEICPTCRRPL